jgi:hypothetical protein
MAPQAGGSLVSRQRVRSISFDPADADRVDTLVELLREAGYAKAARAEVARAALQELHHVLAGRTRARSPHQSGSPAVGCNANTRPRGGRGGCGHRRGGIDRDFSP